MNLKSGLGIAAVLLLAGTGAAALAQPNPDGDGGKADRFVIIHDGKADPDSSKGERVREFRIVRDGEAHGRAGGPELRRFAIRDGAIVECDGGDKIVDESAAEDGKKTKVIICTKGQPSPTPPGISRRPSRESATTII